MEETAGAAGGSEGRRPRWGGEAKAAAASAVPSCYHRPSGGSCHHVCKYGGAHDFEERDPRRAAQPRPRKQQQPPAKEVSDRTAAAHAPATALAKLRSASSRRRVGDLTKPGKSRKPAAAADEDTVKKDAGEVVWKDILAYESIPLPPEKTTIARGDAKKKKDVSVTEGKKSIISSSHGKAKIVDEPTGDVIAANTKPADGSPKKKKKKKPIKSVGSKLTGKQPPSPGLKSGEKAIPHSDKNSKKMIKSNRTTSVKPPKPKKNLVEIGQEISQKDLSPPPSSSTTAANDIKEEKPHNPLAQEENPGNCMAPMPPPAHRRAKSMSITGTKSVRFPFTRQASRTASSTTTFKVVVRSKSSRAAAPPDQQDPAPAPTTTRLRFFRRGDAGGSSSGGSNGIHLRMRSLRRRGSIGSGGGTAAAGGFVVPAVALRHQKTLEKKRSRRLYNSVIEETAGKLAKARKSRVKALVGAFESLISKIGK